MLAPIVFVMLTRTLVEDTPDRASSLIFFRLIAEFEFAGWAVLFAGVLTAVSVAKFTARPVLTVPRGNVGTLETMAVAVCAATVALLLQRWALLAYPFSMDEYAADWQANLFANGQWGLAIPREWIPHDPGVRPVFINTPTPGHWVSGYLPGNALWRAVWIMLGLPELASPALALCAVATTARIAVRLFPDDKESQRTAIYTLAGSTQFLAVAGTSYAMGLHLVVNLAWLWAWLQPSRVRYLCGPLSLFAIVIHQPFPHLLFALPFHWRAVRERQWRGLTIDAAWCLSGLLLAAAWYTHAGGVQGGGSLHDLVGVPTLLSLFSACLSLLVAISWSSPLFAVSLWCAPFETEKTSDIERLLWASIGTTLAFYLFFRLGTQGHGWGWRYGHQLLGSFALATAAALPRIRTRFGLRHTAPALVASILCAALLQLPLRFTQMRSTVAPFQRAAQYLRGVDADLVIIPTDSIWYGRDLIRNDFRSRGPVLMHEWWYQAANRPPLPPGVRRIRRIGVTELVDIGLERVGAAPR